MTSRLIDRSPNKGCRPPRLTHTLTCARALTHTHRQKHTYVYVGKHLVLQRDEAEWLSSISETVLCERDVGQHSAVELAQHCWRGSRARHEHLRRGRRWSKAVVEPALVEGEAGGGSTSVQLGPGLTANMSTCDWDFSASPAPSVGSVVARRAPVTLSACILVNKKFIV